MALKKFNYQQALLSSLLFLFGAGIGATGLFYWLGWSVVAFMALTPWVSMGILVGAGCVALTMRYILPFVFPGFHRVFQTAEAKNTATAITRWQETTQDALGFVRNLIVFTVFAGVGFAGLMVYFQLGVLAVLLVSPWIGVAVVLGAGVLGLGLRYIVPAVLRPLLARWAKTRIENAIKDLLTSCPGGQRDASNTALIAWEQSLLSWLKLANQGEFDFQKMLKYQVPEQDNPSLMQYALNQSNQHHQNYISQSESPSHHEQLLAQSYAKGLYGLWQMKTFYDAHPGEIQETQEGLRWTTYQRLLRWMQKTGEPTPAQFEAEMLDAQAIKNSLKQSMKRYRSRHQGAEQSSKQDPNRPTSTLPLPNRSIAHPWTPASVVERTFAAPPAPVDTAAIVRQAIDQEADGSNAPEVVMQVAQQIEQDYQVAEQAEIDVKAVLGQAVSEDVSAVDYVLGSEIINKFAYYPEHYPKKQWLKALAKKRTAAYPDKPFCFSKQAEALITNSGSSIRFDSTVSIDLNFLPLGFSLKEQDEIIIVHFSKADRQFQLEHPEQYQPELRDDPFGSLQKEKPGMFCWKDDRSTYRGIDLPEAIKTFLKENQTRNLPDFLSENNPENKDNITLRLYFIRILERAFQTCPDTDKQGWYDFVIQLCTQMNEIGFQDFKLGVLEQALDYFSKIPVNNLALVKQYFNLDAYKEASSEQTAALLNKFTFEPLFHGLICPAYAIQLSPEEKELIRYPIDATSGFRSGREITRDDHDLDMCHCEGWWHLAQIDTDNFHEWLTIYQQLPRRFFSGIRQSFGAFIKYLQGSSNELKLAQELPNFSEVEIAWFNSLIWHESGNFEQAMRGLLFCFDFFKKHGFELPPANAIHVEIGRDDRNENPASPFLRLKSIIDCITLAGKSDETAQAYQAQLMPTMPKNLTLALSALRSGYSLVHQAMFLEAPVLYTHTLTSTHNCYEKITAPTFEEFFQDQLGEASNSLMITDHQLHRIEYQAFGRIEETRLDKENREREYIITTDTERPLYYFALFLRYLAPRVSAEDLMGAIAKWEEITGHPIQPPCTTRGYYRETPLHRCDDYLHQQNTALQEKWPTLKAYALNLGQQQLAQASPAQPASASPDAAEIPTLTAALAKAKQFGVRDDEQQDIDRLLAQLDLSDEKKTQLRAQIQTFNEHIQTNTALNAQDLAAQLKDARNDDLDDIARLALLAEAHYRITSNPAEKKPGECLRLEQFVAILLLREGNSLLEVATGEGKTLIFQLTAILAALKGEKTDIITHNEQLAQQGFDGLQRLAALTGVTVCQKNNPPEQVIDADILYVDVSSLVIAQKQAQFAEDDQPHLGKREANCALVDEVDAILDIHASTTMQITQGVQASTQEEQTEFEAFLLKLNEIIRKQFSEPSDDQEHELIHMRQALTDKNTPCAAQYKNDLRLRMWIKAARKAMHLQRDTHYVIKNNKVVIVHHETTGRLDYKSHWGGGVHQCVAAWEGNKRINQAKLDNQQDEDEELEAADNSPKNHADKIIIPPLSQVIAEGDIGETLARYQTRSGASGTLGTANVQQAMNTLIGTTAEKPTTIIPRAKRLGKGRGAWQLVADGEGGYQKVYKRIYTAPPRYFETTTEQLTHILTGLKNARQQGLSSLVFFKTIAECRIFQTFLCTNGLEQDLQILDDTHKEGDQSAYALPEATVIAQAGQPGKITLTTAAGSRGTDFDGVDVAFIATPDLQTIKSQKAGRVGRNGKRAMVHTLLSLEDDPMAKAALTALPAETAQPAAENADRYKRADFERWVQPYEKQTRAHSLETIKKRTPIRKLKARLQATFVAYRQDKEAAQQQKLTQAWANFFTDMDLQLASEETDQALTTETLEKNQHLNTAWQEAFQGTDTSLAEQNLSNFLSDNPSS